MLLSDFSGGIYVSIYPDINSWGDRSPAYPRFQCLWRQDRQSLV